MNLLELGKRADTGDKKATADVMRGLTRFLELTTAAIWHIENIKKTEEPEVIQVSIEVLQKLDNQIADLFGHPHRDMKAIIRSGIGDFKLISEKCIRLNLV